MLRAQRKPIAPRRYMTGVVVQPLDEASIPTGERERLRRLILVMADRRVLGPGWYSLQREEVLKSVGKMRSELRDISRLLTEGSPAHLHVEAIRAICRQFSVRATGDGKALVQNHDYHYALGAFRAQLGLQVALLAERYGIAIDPRLESILPPAEE